MVAPTTSVEAIARTRGISEMIPETDEEKVAKSDAEDESWRHSLSQLPPLGYRQPSYAGSHSFHREWKPKCNHYTMTRLYYPKYKCDNCGHPGPSGWLYRCTVDREALIILSKEKGLPYAFDSLGRRFAETMTLGKRGPQARADKLSFLKELNKEELATYTPEQLVIISKQRDNVAAKIEESRKDKAPYPDRPWMPSPDSECQFKVCQSCHHFAKEKSYVSLDAIVNDEVPPTVATAYGFGLLGFRQMSHVDVVKNAGYRPIPLPRFHPARRGYVVSPDSVLGRLRREHAERIAAGEVDEWAKHRENFPPRGSLRRTTHLADVSYLLLRPSDRAVVRNAVDCITGGPRNVVNIPEPPRRETSEDDEDAAILLRVRNRQEQQRRNLPNLPIYTSYTLPSDDDDTPRQVTGMINLGNSSPASSSLFEPIIVQDEPEAANNTSLLADIGEGSECSSSGTWETSSAAGEGSGISLTEEAVEQGTPDLVVAP